MTAVSISSLPFALQVQSIINSIRLSDDCAIAEKLVNPICLKGFQSTAHPPLRENCLRQLRLEAHSSVLLRQLAKSIHAPVLVVDPTNLQGGFIQRDATLTQHPQIDLHPNAAIDFILAGQAQYQSHTLHRGDAIMRRVSAGFDQLAFSHAEVFRVVYYHAIAMAEV